MGSGGGEGSCSFADLLLLPRPHAPPPSSPCPLPPPHHLYPPSLPPFPPPCPRPSPPRPQRTTSDGPNAGIPKPRSIHPSSVSLFSSLRFLPPSHVPVYDCIFLFLRFMLGFEFTMSLQYFLPRSFQGGVCEVVSGVLPDRICRPLICQWVLSHRSCQVTL